MRTTVEIPEELHRAVMAIARRRGLRGFSPVVEEALTAYVRDLGTDETDLLLSLEGILSDDEEQEMRSRIGSARAVWRTS